MTCQTAPSRLETDTALPRDAEAVRALEAALLQACPPRERSTLARFLQMLPSLPHTRQMLQFQAAVDASDFGAADWAGAGAVLQEWLERQGRACRFDKKLGYLTCCAESLAATPPALRPTLAKQVALMLCEYGFAG